MSWACGWDRPACRIMQPTYAWGRLLSIAWRRGVSQPAGGRLGGPVLGVGGPVTCSYVSCLSTTLVVLPGLAYRLGCLGPALVGLGRGGRASACGTAVGAQLTTEA